MKKIALALIIIVALIGSIKAQPSAILAVQGNGSSNLRSYNIGTNSWASLASSPAGINRGGALTIVGNFLYAVRGGDTRNFYRYDIANNSWTSLANTLSDVDEGASLTSDGTYIYATRGDKNTTFWRYDIANNSWSTLTSMPGGIHHGGASVILDNFIYTLRGDDKRNFYRYNISNDSWSTLSNTPSDVYKGGALTTDGTYIYALRGDESNNFWRYNIDANSWSSLATTPGSIDEGAALAFADNYIYALRGNSNNFYRYDISNNTWSSMTNFPASALYGAALASFYDVEEEDEEEIENAIQNVEITAAFDTEIWTDKKDDNYGTCNKIYINRSPQQRGLIEFDLSSIPEGAEIVSASLRLQKIGGKNGAHNLSVHRVTSEWTEGTGGCSNGTKGNATWNRRTTNTPWSTVGGDFNSTPEATTSVAGNGTYDWNITDLVQNWVNEIHPNYGILLKFTSESGGDEEKDFASRDNSTASNRPRLIISYQLPLSATVDVTHISCFGENNGSLTANVSGGTSPYTYAWSGGENSAVINNAIPGSYTVTVTDAEGTSVTAEGILTAPSEALLGVVTITQQISCFGNNNGSVTANASGGMPPYTYSWSGGATIANRTGLSAGNYTVTITDNSGCSITANNTLTQPAVLESSAIINQQESNLGSNDGSITANVTGGTTPYTYNWSNGATTADITGLSMGTYKVTVTDNAGCTSTANNTIMPNNIVIWLGTSNKDWGRAANWSNNQVPTETDNVYIPNGTPYRPEIDDNETYSVNHIYFDSLATLTFDDDDSRLNVKGNFYVNHCGFGFDEGRVYYNGSVAQYIYAPCKIQFERLYIENTSSTGVYLVGASIQINHELLLRDGYVYTNGDTVIVARNSANNSIKEYNEDDSHVVGYLTRYLNRNRDTYAFPVGKGSADEAYLISIKNNNMNGISQLTTIFRDLDEDPQVISNLLANANIQEDGVTYTRLCEEGMWTIEPNIQPTSGSYSVIADLKNFKSVTSTELGILKKPTGSHATNWGLGNGVRNNNIVGNLGQAISQIMRNSRAERGGLTSFSDFGVGDEGGGSGLPIELLSFTGEMNAKTKAVDLFWTTATEINNEKFLIQRSLDGENFEDLGEVAGAGNSNIALSYQFSDNKPVKGIAYYRLKQIDFDGKYAYTDLISVTNSSTSITTSDVEVKVYPNPTDGLVNILAPTDEKEIHVHIIDMNGAVIKALTVNNESETLKLSIDLREHLVTGNYFIKVSGQNFANYKKIQVFK